MPTLYNQSLQPTDRASCHLLIASQKTHPPSSLYQPNPTYRAVTHKKKHQPARRDARATPINPLSLSLPLFLLPFNPKPNPKPPTTHTLFPPFPPSLLPKPQPAPRACLHPFLSLPLLFPLPSSPPSSSPLDHDQTTHIYTSPHLPTPKSPRGCVGRFSFRGYRLC